MNLLWISGAVPGSYGFKPQEKESFLEACWNVQKTLKARFYAYLNITFCFSKIMN